MVSEQVNKLKGEKYKLIWKDSPDFVRLASKLDCTIVPFAAVGGGHHHALITASDSSWTALLQHLQDPCSHLSTMSVLHVAQAACISAAPDQPCCCT